MNLFYCAEINPALPLLLPEEESTHCIRVLRMKTGDTLFLTNGKGMFYQGQIISDHPKRCTIKIIQSISDGAKRNFQLTIAIAPTKNSERFEWFLEKATEIGCDDIIPIVCTHSERTVLNAERLHKVIVSAMKQCLKSQLPCLHGLQSFKTFVSSTKNFNGQKFIGHIPELSGSAFPPQSPLGKSLQAVCRKGENILVAIGPEGGFSEEEVATAVQSGFTLINLGNSRLRVETAAIVACSILNAVNLTR